MIATGHGHAAVPHTKPLPAPTTARPITPRHRPRGLDWTKHAAPAIDPDAIARLERQGVLTVTEQVIEAKPVKVVKKTKPRKPRKTPGPKPGSRRPPKFDVAAAVKAYESGTSLSALATLHGCSRDTMRYHLTKAGVKIERRGNSRPFTPDEVQRATELYLAGQTLKQVGAQIGRSHAGVHNALRGAGVLPRRHYVRRKAS